MVDKISKQTCAFLLGERLSTFLRMGGVSISAIRDSIGVRWRGTRERLRKDLSDTCKVMTKKVCSLNFRWLQKGPEC